MWPGCISRNDPLVAAAQPPVTPTHAGISSTASKIDESNLDLRCMFLTAFQILNR